MLYKRHSTFTQLILRSYILLRRYLYCTYMLPCKYIYYVGVIRYIKNTSFLLILTKTFSSTTSYLVNTVSQTAPILADDDYLAINTYFYTSIYLRIFIA